MITPDGGDMLFPVLVKLLYSTLKNKCSWRCAGLAVSVSFMMASSLLNFLFSLLLDSPSEVEPCLGSEPSQGDGGLLSSLCIQSIEKVVKFYYLNCKGRGWIWEGASVSGVTVTGCLSRGVGCFLVKPDGVHTGMNFGGMVDLVSILVL